MHSSTDFARNPQLSQSHRVIVATDIPFWLMANGAQQRMAAVSRVFRRSPFEWRVFYLGAASDEILAAARNKEIPLELFQRGEPTGLFVSALAKLDRLRGKGRSSGDAKRDPTLTLADYAWPNAKRQFAKLLRQVNPQTVILEYVTMTYLAHVVRDNAPQARLVLDSHDVLHRRCAQFNAAGYRHWLQISEQEEIDAVRQVDVILAIQDDEASWFRQVAPASKVLTVGHSFDFEQLQPVWREPNSGPPVIGYFGSNNGSNIDAVTGFVKQAWPSIAAKVGGGIELLIGGTIVDSPIVRQCAEIAGVRLHRDYASPAAFYAAVDLVINPVQFGTGLKIKTVEALAHGRPVITTGSGRIGISETFDPVCVAVDSPSEMVDPIVERVRDRGKLRELSQRAYQSARAEFSEESILGEFRQLLLAESERPAGKTPRGSQKILE